ncbi:D-aminoacyl-tRNA deacylase [Microaceticoccus formicicus]|uniref:D-aminoacyl-tRNA deacylase n=1 Tax=Microaceticoccus formicicus TaxID=3118105 RepID=UPI003CD0471E|nr:D-aminoacyl-tRNA deacylase [Peptoniphilaceae bacterium AMB_02]
MRAIVQKVKKVSVSIEGELYSSINSGLLVFIAVTHTDTEKDKDYMIDKILGLRIFEDQEGKMNLSLDDVGGEIMVISQFTLYGDVRRGKRPSFTRSAGGDFAENMYLDFVEGIRAGGYDVKTGEFGADMKVQLINDGPVTIQLDSEKLY